MVVNHKMPDGPDSKPAFAIVVSRTATISTTQFWQDLRSTVNGMLYFVDRRRSGQRSAGRPLRL
jgi:hypothetical protein